ncbi:hypothetical protein IWX90DRAFT_414747 [Phyllosticta citrichinensis]|uniref:Uncharacterized protein n=1 Tax=Phyllosticta citrichinensis TaxID=1130410 RepID=A0ABR1XST9_9PEZI
MVNILSVSMAALAVSAPAVAHPTSLEPRAASGCTIDLASTMTTPSAPGEIIIMSKYFTCFLLLGAVSRQQEANHRKSKTSLTRAAETMIKWTKSTDMSSFDSSYCDWSNTAKAPYSVFFKANTIPGYTTLDDLSAVLQPWVGSWLIAGNSGAPNSGVTGDYNITTVTCS